MPSFAQMTRLTATPGNADALLAKFAAAADIQRDNPACALMIAARSGVEPDVVHLIEVWSSEQEWEAARSAPAIAEWARDMPPLVSAPPETTRLNSVVGTGLAPRL